MENKGIQRSSSQSTISTLTAENNEARKLNINIHPADQGGIAAARANRGTQSTSGNIFQETATSSKTKKGFKKILSDINPFNNSSKAGKIKSDFQLKGEQTGGYIDNSLKKGIGKYFKSFGVNGKKNSMQIASNPSPANNSSDFIPELTLNIPPKSNKTTSSLQKQGLSSNKWHSKKPYDSILQAYDNAAKPNATNPFASVFNSKEYKELSKVERLAKADLGYDQITAFVNYKRTVSTAKKIEEAEKIINNALKKSSEVVKYGDNLSLEIYRVADSKIQEESQKIEDAQQYLIKINERINNLLDDTFFGDFFSQEKVDELLDLEFNESVAVKEQISTLQKSIGNITTTAFELADENIKATNAELSRYNNIILNAQSDVNDYLTALENETEIKNTIAQDFRDQIYRMNSN